jgi:hypothetical protein
MAGNGFVLELQVPFTSHSCAPFSVASSVTVLSSGNSTVLKRRKREIQLLRVRVIPARNPVKLLRYGRLSKREPVIVFPVYYAISDI